LQALERAAALREPPPGWLHHSDRGCQYTGTAYQTRLAELGAVVSMSRRGNCWDNAPVESGFGTIKTEKLHRQRFHTMQELRHAISTYIHGFYNPKRFHKHNNNQSPDQAEQAFHNNQQRLAS
jgi:transposase InsO family protein